MQNGRDCRGRFAIEKLFSRNVLPEPHADQDEVDENDQVEEKSEDPQAAHHTQATFISAISHHKNILLAPVMSSWYLFIFHLSLVRTTVRGRIER